MTAESMLMVVRQDHPALQPDAEPVLVEHTGSETVLVLDDGIRLTFDRAELAAHTQLEAIQRKREIAA